MLYLKNKKFNKVYTCYDDQTVKKIDLGSALQYPAKKVHIFLSCNDACYFKMLSFNIAKPFVYKWFLPSG